MLLKDIKEYAQSLVAKGLSEDEIKELVAKKIGNEKVVDDEGNEVKDLNLELEEKEDEELEINIKKIAKKEVEKAVKVNDKKIDFTRIEVKDVPFKQFKNINQAHSFAKYAVPEYVLQKFGNTKALSTYQNITTDADGGSFDVVTANGLLADSVAKYPSYVEDTLQVPVYGSSATFIDHTSDATAYVYATTGEATAITESKPGNTTRTVTLAKVATLCPITGELLRFGTLADIAAVTLDTMGRAISKKLQHLIFTSDATADTTDGSVQGLIDAMTDVASNSSLYTVVGTWSTLALADIAKVVAMPAGYADPNKFAWYCHRNMWGYLEAIARAAGGTTYVQIAGQRPIPQLFGYPVKFVDQMVSATTEDKVGLLFGDLSSAIATAVSADTYIDVSPDFYFSQDVTCFRAIKHLGTSVFAPGTNGTVGGVVAVYFNAGS